MSVNIKWPWLFRCLEVTWFDWYFTGVSTLLTMIIQTNGITASLPSVSYMKAIDVWIHGCLAFVFSTLIEFALVNYGSRSGLYICILLLRFYMLLIQCINCINWCCILLIFFSHSWCMCVIANTTTTTITQKKFLFIK